MTTDTIDTATSLLELFPPNTTLAGDELVIGGCRATDLVAQFGTPVLVIDEEALRARARRYADGLASRWPNSLVVWASKSLSCTGVYRVLQEEGLGIDVAGGGELMMALAGGADPGKIVMHGNAKTFAELEMAVQAGVGTIVIDNFDDIDRLETIVTVRQDVLVRVIPDVVVDTHEAFGTGHRDSKFGLSIADTRIAIERIERSEKLHLEGVHMHIGSQIMETEPFIRAVEAIASLGEFSTYDLGGGLGARYSYEDNPPSIEEYLDALIVAARRVLPPTARILIEPGRSMVADTATTLYSVTTVKRSETRTFVAVDGGMSDNLEVSLYDQRFEATIANRFGEGEDCTLVGRHCESGDQLISSISLREPSPGDIVAVPATGAYCLTMANNYNGTRRAPVAFVSKGTSRLTLRRETYADMLSRDIHPDE